MHSRRIARTSGNRATAAFASATIPGSTRAVSTASPFATASKPSTSSRPRTWNRACTSASVTFASASISANFGSSAAPLAVSTRNCACAAGREGSVGLPTALAPSGAPQGRGWRAWAWAWAWAWESGGAGRLVAVGGRHQVALDEGRDKARQLGDGACVGEIVHEEAAITRNADDARRRLKPLESCRHVFALLAAKRPSLLRNLKRQALGHL